MQTVGVEPRQPQCKDPYNQDPFLSTRLMRSFEEIKLSYTPNLRPQSPKPFVRLLSPKPAKRVQGFRAEKLKSPTGLQSS